jgi:hypothetical protein
MTTQIINSNHRRSDRISLPLPILVESKKGNEVSWSETSRLKTVTTFGAGFNLEQEVVVGQVLHLTTAFPTKLRCYDYLETQYKVWALVRHCNLLTEPKVTKSYSIGVAFLGKNPPPNYFQNPSRLYTINQFDRHGLCIVGETENHPPPPPKTLTPQKHPRYEIPFEVIIETLDERKNPLEQEFTVTENVSLGGAAVKTLLNTKVGNLVRVSCLGKDVSIIAAVRNYRMGEDGVPRMHLEFLDRQFPLEGIE